jgi:hypothetical protein
MTYPKTVRWMVVFWHPNGEARCELDFPEVAFWHPDRRSARQEAARVLTELREERGDKREWVAAGYPDPMEAGAGNHPLGQWFLRYRDLEHGSGEAVDTRSPNNGKRRTQSAAGAWRGIIDGEELKRTLYEARRTGSRA